MFSTFNSSQKFGHRLGGSPFVSSGLYLHYNPLTSYSGSGSTLTDLSGNSRNATMANSPGWTAGNAYLTFDGSSNQYYYTPNIYNGSGNKNHTIEVWTYPTSTSINLFSDASQGNTGSQYHNSGMQFFQVSSFQQYISNLWASSPGVQRVVNGAGALLNGWRQVVRTYDGTTLTPYLNGVAGTSAAVSWNAPWESISGQWWLIFGGADGTAYSGTTANLFAGKMGVVRVYSRALSAAEVKQNFNATRVLYGL